MFKVEPIEVEPIFNMAIHIHNVREGFYDMICRGTLGASSLQGLAVKHCNYAKKHFGLTDQAFEKMMNETLEVLHTDSLSLVTKLSYSFEDLRPLELQQIDVSIL